MIDGNDQGKEGREKIQKEQTENDKFNQKNDQINDNVQTMRPTETLYEAKRQPKGRSTTLSAKN